MAAFFPTLTILAAALFSGDSGVADKSPGPSTPTQTNGLCTECSQIIQVPTNLIASRRTLEASYEALASLCSRLPAEQQEECKWQVKSYLTKELQHTGGNLNQDKACVFFGLCTPPSDQELKLSSQATETTVHSNLLSEPHVDPVCMLCLYIMKKLENLLPQNVTEDALEKLMEEICDLIPHSYKDECDDFVAKYGTEIVEFLLSDVAPHTVCFLLHLCLFDQSADKAAVQASPPSDCESCRTLAALSRLHLGLNSTHSQASSFLQSVCSLHPLAIPQCEAFTQRFGTRLQKFLQNQRNFPGACERADICKLKKAVEPLRRNRCTLGPTYWCKDVKTAQECGNLAHCEKYVWQ